jgi:PTH1 family peptidyl-tRNA hydrolase
LKSIIDALGTQNFPRVRIGIGRSPHAPADVHVLSKIPKAEEPVYEDAVGVAVRAVESVLTDGIEKAMNTYNQKR